MAFVRRKGNTYFLVHNVRRGDKVKQLHLARQGERPRITDDMVRQVSRAYPFLDVNWPALREQVNNQVELFDSKSAYVRKLGCSRPAHLNLGFGRSVSAGARCFRRSCRQARPGHAVAPAAFDGRRQSSTNLTAPRGAAF